MSHPSQTVPTDIEVPATSLWARLPLLGGAVAVIGLGSVLANVGGEGRARAMFSYLFAFEVCLSIALGALGWVLIDHVARTGWSTVLRRLGETTMMTVPVLAFLWLPIAAAGMQVLYPWTHTTDVVLERKRWFLTEGFFMGRAALYWAIWVVLAYVLYSLSIRRDSADESQRDALTRRMWIISAPGITLWALSLSFQAIDWLMSLQPHWYSTIFGVYFFAGAILSFYAFVTLVTMGLQKAGILKSAVNAEHFHDLGKFIFGYTIFWAYIAFSQFLLIWYANIPEENEFYLARLHGGWGGLSYALPLIHFFVPFFFLLSRHVKRNRLALGLGAAWTLLMQVVDIYWLVLPNFHSGEQVSMLSPNWMDVAALLGMVGAFLAAFGFLLKRHKVLAVNDPRLFESLAHENY